MVMYIAPVRTDKTRMEMMITCCLFILLIQKNYTLDSDILEFLSTQPDNGQENKDHNQTRGANQRHEPI